MGFSPLLRKANPPQSLAQSLVLTSCQIIWENTVCCARWEKPEEEERMCILYYYYMRAIPDRFIWWPCSRQCLFARIFFCPGVCRVFFSPKQHIRYVVVLLYTVCDSNNFASITCLASPWEDCRMLYYIYLHPEDNTAACCTIYLYVRKGHNILYHIVLLCKNIYIF